MASAALLKYISYTLFIGATVYGLDTDERRPLGEPTDIALSAVLRMSSKEFARNTAGQRIIFDTASKWHDEMSFFCGKLRNKLDVACNISLKANTHEQLAALVAKKCRRKGYKTIGEMHDFARGRINVNFKDDINVVLNEISKLAQEIGAEVKIILPKKPIKIGHEIFFGYPRHHVLMKQKDSFVFEWQIGTKTLTYLYENYYNSTEIDIPTTLKLPPHIKKNLHDIAYKIFYNILTELKTSSNPQPVDVVLGKSLDKFLKSLNQVSARADSFGMAYVDLPRDRDWLHAQASLLLAKIVKLKGPRFVLEHLQF